MVQSLSLQRDVTLAILAGGEGSRMGTPKGNLILSGLPVLTYLHRRFAWPGPTLLVTGPKREKPRGCELFTAEVVDPVARTGPLRGLLTALQNLRTPMLVAAPVDMPNLSREHMEWLAGELNDRPHRLGLLLRRRCEDQEEIESLPCALRVEAIPHIEQQIARQHRAIHSLLKNPLFTSVLAPNSWTATTWLNLNTKDDLAQFEKLNPVR